MRTVTLDKPSKRIRGTGLLERVTCSYTHLIHMLGAPTIRLAGDHKTYNEWHVHVSPADVMLSVYDYKQPRDPATHASDPVVWHVGGMTADQTQATQFVRWIKR